MTVSPLVSHGEPVPKQIEKLLAEMRATPKAISFSDAMKVAEHYFGESRQKGSHHIFKMPWAGNPRINLQDDGDNAKAYQVRQIVDAVDKLELERANAQPAQAGSRSKDRG